MQNNKSPGSDGITTEFYKIFWSDIKNYYIKSLNYSFENGDMTDMQKQGLISLLPKTNNDLGNLNNWRPLSLLNIDYKIVTKTISNRIKKYISHIIENSITGFIKGRYTRENIRLIQETIEALEGENHPGLILFADFKKAFDSISHDFMFNCLKCFNFETDIIRWIKCFYNDVKSSVTNSGYMTEFFHIKRGLRQGCPLSAYLFIICIELLDAAVRENKNIGGISSFGNDFKSSMFADDATFALDGTFNSF